MVFLRLLFGSLYNFRNIILPVVTFFVLIFAYDRICKKPLRDLQLKYDTDIKLKNSVIEIAGKKINSLISENVNMSTRSNAACTQELIDRFELTPFEMAKTGIEEDNEYFKGLLYDENNTLDLSNFTH